MSAPNFEEDVQEVFRKVLRNPELRLSRLSTAQDVEGWTSLTHVRLMVGIEEKFKIRFSATEIIGFRNYGELLDCVSMKVGQS